MKKQKSKKTSKDLLNSVKNLTIVFILLLILVIFLFILCVIKYKESKENEFANMVIPVYELNTDYEFNINAKTLSEVNEYVFKITNYKKGKINTKKIPYKIEIKNDTNSKIKVTKNDSNKNLMTNKKETIIDQNTLKIDKKENIYYHIKITKSANLTAKDLIYIKITN